MELCNHSEILALLSRHGFHFSKAKGQNFLTADWVPTQIAEQADVDGQTGVLEVGPGIGCLTRELCLRAYRVAAVELDERLRPVLTETMAGLDNLSIVFSDILKCDLPALVSEQLPGLRRVACANLPYYITTPVLSKLLESRLFESVTVMVQKEVAQRIAARAGTANYGAFTVFCQWYGEPEILFDVPPDCFTPRPKVTSSVLRLAVRKAPPCAVQDEEMFFRTVRTSFAMRRKTLVNGLSAGFPSLTKSQLSDMIVACGHRADIRGETLDIPSFAEIANLLTALTTHQ